MIETKMLKIDQEYTLLVDKENRQYTLTKKRLFGKDKCIKKGNIMSVQQLANVVLNASKMTQEMYELFVVQSVANSMLGNDLKDIRLTFDSGIYMTGTLGYCTYLKTSQQVFFSPEILAKTANIRSIFIVLNAIEHEFAHILDFKNTPISYQKFDNENGRKAELPGGSVFAEIVNAVSRHDTELAKQFRDAVRLRYTNSQEETFARMQALKKNDEFLRAIKEEAKHLCEALPKRQAEYLKVVEISERYVKENIKKEADGQFLSSPQKANGEQWEKLRDVTREVIKEYCNVNSKNKYIRNSREFCSFTENLGVTVLALDCEELACQENYDNLFEYYARDIKTNWNSLLVVYLLIGLKHNTRSREMLEKLFENRSKSERKFLLFTVEQIRKTLNQGDYPEYPRTDIKHFYQAAREKYEYLLQAD